MITARTIATLAALWLATASAVAAATVYRWVDEQGRVHYAELVPERYRSVARPVQAPTNDPSAEQLRAAQQRAQSDKDRAAALAAERRLPAASASVAPAASRPVAKRPAQVPNDQTDCETWRRLYVESIECFGPFRTVRGATKPEAFDVCTVVEEPPTTRCRPRIP